MPKLTLLLPVAAVLTFLSQSAALADLSAEAKTLVNGSDARKLVTLSNGKHMARSVTRIEINAPQTYVWGVLTNFSNYPDTFDRIKSCRIVKREGDLVFTECFLKPHLFLNESCQHTINDLGGAPSLLTWRTTDGNFKALGGKWELKSTASGDKCVATYTLQVDAGGVIPPPLIGAVLHSMQKEIVASVKKTAEIEYQDQHLSTSKLPQPKPVRGNG